LHGVKRIYTWKQNPAILCYLGKIHAGIKLFGFEQQTQ